MEFETEGLKPQINHTLDERIQPRGEAPVEPQPGGTRAQHLAWCKQRALQYFDAGDLPNAFASMTSDMGKHPDTKMPAILGQLGLTYVFHGDQQQLLGWIVGFN